MDYLAPLVLLTPLAGFLINALLGRLLPRRAVGWVGAGSIGLAFVFTLAILAQVLGGQKLDQTYFTWWQSGDFNVPFNLYVDAVSTLMILVITGVGFLIHVYSIGYMREDPGFSRFFAYMNLFVFSMLLLVLSGNLVWLIIGWALVGLSSYLLIGFWFERTSAVLAARKAFVMNTIGDVGMVFAAFLIFLNLRVVDYQGLFSRIHLLYDWAPAAAATVAVIGGVTALFAATIGTSQVDIKRILAYSTMSQIGYMFLAVGIGAYAAGMFHFMTHAFFKALLFMAAGNVIHAFHDEQDIRKMGNLRRGLPITFWTFLVGTLAISGAPLLSGFFSKDQIIHAAVTMGPAAPLLGLIALFTAGLTVFYMFRLFFIAFGWEWLPEDPRHLHEAPPVQTVPVIILAGFAIIGGYIGVGGFLQPVLGKTAEATPAEFLGLAAVTTVVALAGFLLAYRLYARDPAAAAAITARVRPVYTLLWRKYYVDELYDRLFVRPGMAVGRFLDEVFEPRVLDGFIDGLVLGIGDLADDWRHFQTGKVRRYALWTLGGAALLTAYLGYTLLRTHSL